MEATGQLNSMSSFVTWAELVAKANILLQLVDDEKNEVEKASASPTIDQAETASNLLLLPTAKLTLNLRQHQTLLQQAPSTSQKQQTVEEKEGRLRQQRQLKQERNDKGKKWLNYLRQVCNTAEWWGKK